MRILYIMSSFPYPPHGGGPLRVMGLLEGAAQAGHELHILTFGSERQAQHLGPLQAFCQQVEVVPLPERSTTQRLQTLLLTSKADMEERTWSPDFLSALEGVLTTTPFDVIQFQSLEMGVYLPHVRRLQPRAKLIYDAYNAESELQRMVYENDRARLTTLPKATYSFMQWSRLMRFETSLCEASDAVLAVSEQDQLLLRRLNHQTPVYLVNNGIDVAAYAIKPDEINLQMRQPSLVFTGTMDYRPNVDAAVWFAEEILPDLEDVTFYIVGNKPTSRIQELAENNPQIVVTGFVEDILPYLHQASVFVVPLRVGSGTRLKLLQAMAAGCAIVSTHVGALGLDVTHGREMLLADSPTHFVEAVELLLRDRFRWLDLSDQARQFVQQRFDWQVIWPRLWQAYEEVLAAPSAHSQ
jgi:glycosyltransferase involved in cell wall biosynthesis